MDAAPQEACHNVARFGRKVSHLRASHTEWFKAKTLAGQFSVTVDKPSPRIQTPTLGRPNPSAPSEEKLTMLYAESVRLRLATGDEVQAFVRAGTSSNCKKCLLLHGNPATLLDWTPLVPLLPSAIELAAIDLPGFGRSPRINSKPECVSLDRFADCAIAVADALSWTEPFFIVGHSHGGGVAQVAAARYPERVAGIVLISSLTARKQGSYRFLALPLAEPALRLAGYILGSSTLRPVGKCIMRRVMKQIWSPEPVPGERFDRDLALFSSRREVLVSMVHVAKGRPCQYIASSAPRIRCPVLMIHGERDALVPVEYARGVHELIVNAGGQSELRILSGAGHAVIDYQSADVANCIAQFLSQHEFHDQGCPSHVRD